MKHVGLGRTKVEDSISSRKAKARGFIFYTKNCNFQFEHGAPQVPHRAGQEEKEHVCAISEVKNEAISAPEIGVLGLHF